jgi:hypothetical protein
MEEPKLAKTAATTSVTNVKVTTENILVKALSGAALLFKGHSPISYSAIGVRHLIDNVGIPILLQDL